VLDIVGQDVSEGIDEKDSMEVVMHDSGTIKDNADETKSPAAKRARKEITGGTLDSAKEENLKAHTRLIEMQIRREEKTIEREEATIRRENIEAELRASQLIESRHRLKHFVDECEVCKK
jgi:hypothetical protein